MKTTVPVAVPARQRFGRFGTRAFRNGIWLGLLALLTLPQAVQAQCTSRKTFDFSTATNNQSWTARSGSVEGVTFTTSGFSSTGNVATFATNSSTFSAQQLVWAANYGNGTGSTGTSSVTITFTRPVTGLRIQVNDIDRNQQGGNGNDFQDAVTFDGFSTATGGTAYNIGTATNATLSIAGLTRNGNRVRDESNTDNAGRTAVVTFLQPVRRLELTYANTQTADSNPGNAAVGIPDLSWCEQADVAATVTGPTTAQANEAVTYTVRTANVGTVTNPNTTTSYDDATAVVPTLTLTPNLPLASLTLPAGASYAAGTGIVTFASVDIARGNSVDNSVTFVMPGSNVSGKTLASGGGIDPVAANNNGTATAANITTTLVRAPVANAVSTPLYANNVRVNLPAFSATDADNDAINFYTFTVPTAAGGNFYLGSASTTPLSGTVNIPAAQAGNLYFNPTGTTTATVSFTYTATENTALALVSAPAQYTINLNQPPVANNDAAVLSLFSTSTINVLSNDTDANGNATIDATTVDLIPGTAAVDRTYTDANGVVFTVSATTGLISFSNPNSFVGTTSVSYRVKDNTGLVSNTATLTLTLTNADPTAVDGVNVAIVNTAGATVLNPSLKGFDGDGNLSYFSITGGLPTAAQGTLRYNGAVVTTSTQISAAQLNLLTFAPASGYVGRVVLSFQAVDSKGQTSAATTYTIPVGAANTITGFVYEDVNYGGGIGRSQAAIGGVGRGSATVELYNSSGTYINSATTAPDGSYSFANPGAGTYTVRVVSSTVSSSRAGYVNTLRPVQTYANGNNQRVGGEAPEKADALARTNQTLAGLNDNSVTPNLTAQSVASVTLAANGAAAADFGFSFDVVVNTNNTGQGSLAQFIANANALANTTAVLDQRPFMNALGATLGTDFPAGQETSIFMIADGTDKPGLRPGLTNQLRNAAGTAATTNSRALIVLTTALPSITGTNSTGTAIDGTTQTTLNDSNPIQLGAGGTVGVDAVTLSQVNGPEVEIASALTGYVLQFNSSNGILRGVAAHGGSGTSGTGSGTVGITGGSATTDMLIEQNLIGTTAFVLARPTAQPGAYMGIWLLNATGTVRNNIIAYNGNSGLNYSSAGLNGGGYTISGNEFTENGATVAGGDAISVGDQATIAAPAGPLLIENNLIRLSNSSGVQFDIGRVSDNVVRNNTIRDNGEGGLASSRLEGSGIHYLNRRSSPNPASSNSDLIERNIITSNQSSGIVINHNQNKVRITRNSIYENGSRTDTDARGLLSIDFTTGPNDGVGGNANYGQGDGVTPNDGVFNTDPNNGQANGGIDYPVITNISKTSTGKLRVQGYIGINPAGNTLFGGATVEIYSANNGDTNQNGPTTTTSGDNVAHGEAQTYIGTLVAAANGTFDVTLNSVSANINPGDNITATAWLANYGTSEAGTNQVSNFVVLPVELTAFEARAVQADAHLTWATAQEKNNARFVVERAAADGRFEAVGEVQGQGTSSTPRAYQFTDAGAARFGQQLFYRLRQVDFDGTSSYSPVRTVAFGPLAARVQLYPNPALGYSVLDLRALPTGSYHVTIADVQGRLQSRQQLTGGAEHRLNVAALRAGVYLVSVRGEAGSWTARLVVQE